MIRSDVPRGMTTFGQYHTVCPCSGLAVDRYLLAGVELAPAEGLLAPGAAAGGVGAHSTLAERIGRVGMIRG